LSFSLAGATLTGDASGMTDPEMLGLLWSTPVGTTVALRMAGLGLLVVGLFAGRVGLILSMIGGVLALWSFVNIGHIPDRGSLLLNLVLMFHLAAISIWIGVLSPLRAISLDAERVSDAADLGHRFGTMAAVFVPLLILAGGYMSYELVGSLSALISGGYGQALVLKVMFVAGLLGLAAANKLRFIPAMTTGDRAAAGRLAKSISFEWIVIVAVLLTTAVLTSVLTLPS
jgi:putative copper resistance protein D